MYIVCCCCCFIFFFKQKTAYEMRISDWSSDVCPSDLPFLARDDKQLLRFQKRLAGLKLLIIDELGFVPLSKTGAELLFEVFSQRYERGATLVTSNLPFDEWTEVFGSERLTGALLDRLTHHVHILEMNGESFRLKQSKTKNKT